MASVNELEPENTCHLLYFIRSENNVILFTMISYFYYNPFPLKETRKYLNLDAARARSCFSKVRDRKENNVLIILKEKRFY